MCIRVAREGRSSSTEVPLLRGPTFARLGPPFRRRRSNSLHSGIRRKSDVGYFHAAQFGRYFNYAVRLCVFHGNLLVAVPGRRALWPRHGCVGVHGGDTRRSRCCAVVGECQTTCWLPIPKSRCCCCDISAVVAGTIYVAKRAYRCA